MSPDGKWIASGDAGAIVRIVGNYKIKITKNNFKI